MEIASLLNYLDDGVRRNRERIKDMKSFLKSHPSKSLQIRKIHGGVYYCLMYREGDQIKQKYLGNRKSVDVKQERERLREYNKKLSEVKRKYRELKGRNDKLERVLNFVLKISDEN